MTVVLRYADPAGNVTALVESPVHPDDRVAVSKRILALGKAEQVGFAVSPIQGGEGRLQMMGGEFCGNATRSFGYLLAKERYGTGLHHIPVEVSGAAAPLMVSADLNAGTASAEMPLPLRLSSLTVGDQTYPRVDCPGICHVLVADHAPDKALVGRILKAAAELPMEAIGVMFLEGTRLTPAVYVRSTDSLVWESSCGSGSMACGWYLSQGKSGGQHVYTFSEPGGQIEVTATVTGGAVSHASIGGRLLLSEPLTLAL